MVIEIVVKIVIMISEILNIRDYGLRLFRKNKIY